MRKAYILWIIAAVTAVSAGFAYDFRHQIVSGTIVEAIDEEEARGHFRAVEAEKLRAACQTHPGMSAEACGRFAACVADRMDGALSYDQMKRLSADANALGHQAPYNDLRVVARDECRAIKAF